MPAPIPSTWLPDASTSVPGKVSIGTQTFGGAKTFSGGITIPTIVLNGASTITFGDTTVQSTAVPAGGTNGYVPVWNSSTNKWVPASPPSGSQWTNDTNGIEYTAGKVGIGMASDSASALLIKGGAPAAGHIAGFYDSGSTLRSFIYTNGAQYWQFYDGSSEAGALYLYSSAGVPYISFYTGTSHDQNRFNIGNYGTYLGLGFDGVHDSALNISSAGKVGIGTTSPGQLLSVAGTIESTTGGLKFPDASTMLTAVPSGGTNGYVPIWNSSTSKWVPGAAGGSSQWTTSSSNIYYTSGSVGVGALGVVAHGATALTLAGNVASGVANILDNSTALTTTGDKLLSVRNATVEKAFIDYRGQLRLEYGVKFSDDTEQSTAVPAGGVDGYIPVWSTNKWVPTAPSSFTASSVFASGVPAEISGSMPDGAGSVAVVLDTGGFSWYTAGAKIVSVRNNGVEKAYIDKDGSLALTGGIKGQKDIQTVLTPTNTSTITMDYSVGNAFFIDASALTSAHAFTMAVSNVPSSNFLSGYTIIVLTGATIPTITWPSGFTAPILTAAAENWMSAASRDGGVTTRLFPIGTF